MAAGLPIICSNVGGLPFLVEDGVNGFLAEPADAQSLAHCLERLLADDMEAMGLASGRAVDEKFSWATIASQTLDAYRQLL
jgi:D-inositol-3-phosphate glycosyltransferase